VRFSITAFFLLGVFLTGDLYGDELLFTCGNHSPRHSALSMDEAAKLTKELGCTNWKVEGKYGQSVSRQQLDEYFNRLKEVYESSSKGTKSKGSLKEDIEYKK
jgi:hypothetical protein